MAGFVERGVITNLIFGYGLLCSWIGINYSREALTLSGFVLSIIAVFRILYFDCILYNPLWTSQEIGALPIFNALLLTYGFPILWSWKATLDLYKIRKVEWCKYGYGFILLLSFIWITMNVRQIFQGTFLNIYKTSNLEIYIYSLAWLMFGIVLLFFGTLRKDKMLRVGSLVIMTLTISKVFIYDVSELEGLLRVFSFFGLGVSLIALSWFYTRFVFRGDDLLGGVRK